MFDLDFDEYFYNYTQNNTKSENDLILEDIEYWEQAQKQFEDYYLNLTERNDKND